MFGSRVKIGVSVLTGLAFLVLSVAVPLKASAQYVEGNLVDDTQFLDASSMSHASIQSFLNARGGALANYSSWSGRDNATVSAAQIIYEAAYDYGVSPKVILATLQKEQSLVTSKNPAASQYNFAMGYGCPDSTGCGSSYSGFYNQVDNGTWQLRYNFERARGNNTWWRNSSSYACGGATRYYSTGLYQGRTVTFLDEAGYGYKTFRLNGAASASLYCYTPHAYPGSSQYYYSGSYNFVVAYENWFGSTQPSVVVSSPLRITGNSTPGLYTNNGVTASFDLTNNTNSPINIGSMSVAVRDSGGGNHDYDLKAMTIPAFATVTYSSTQSFPAEGNYTFWITNYNGGAWSDNSPTSSNIDNARRVTSAVKPMPVVTAQPAASATDMRMGKAANMTFTVQNPSSTTAIDAGLMGLAVRSPSGANVDLPLKSVTIPAGGSYVYTNAFTPTEQGTYTTFITETPDNGSSWYENTFPATANGINRKVNFLVNTSPTITQSPTISTATPHVGQQVTTSFKVKNFGDASVNAGVLALAIRDPQGRNVDAGAVNLTLNANNEYTFTANKTFDTPGTYTAWITNTRDGGRTWDDTDYPRLEDGSTMKRRITFTVLPSPTITVQPHITTTDPRTGKGITASFTMHNFGSQSVTVGSVALAARDPQGRNSDFALQDVTIPAGQDYVYTANIGGASLTKSGTYTTWVTVTRDGGKTWDDTSYPAAESSSINRKVTFDVKDGLTLTQGPALSIATPHVGQQVATTFKVKNFGESAIDVGVLGMAIRDPQGRNVDSGAVSLTVNANSEYVFSANATFQAAGTYTAWITGTRDGGKTWDDTGYPPVESGSVLRKITFTVQP